MSSLLANNNPQIVASTSIFEDFDFKKYKAIVYPLIAIVVVLIINRIIYSNPAYPATIQRGGMLGLLDAFDDRSTRFSSIQNVAMHLLQTLSFIILFSWEAIYEKKKAALLPILLLTIPQFIINEVIFSYYLNTSSQTSSSGELILGIWSILYSFISPFAIYGLIRCKFLLKERLSIMGYLLGFFLTAALGMGFNIFWDFLSRLIQTNSFTIFCFTCKMIFSPIIFYLFYFYLMLLAGGSQIKPFRIFKVLNTAVLSKSNFTGHFIILFTSLVFILIHLNSNLIYTTRVAAIYGLFSIGQIIFHLIPLIIVFLLFSRLQLEQLNALGRLPLWPYLLGFIPVINLIPLFNTYRSDPINIDRELREIDDMNSRRSLQITLVIVSIALVTLQFIFIANGDPIAWITVLIPIFAYYMVLIYYKKGFLIALVIILLMSILSGISLYERLSEVLYQCVIKILYAYVVHTALFWKYPISNK